MEENAQDRDDHDVERRNKTCLAGSGHADAVLLEGACNEEEDTADDAVTIRAEVDPAILNL